MDGNNRSNNIFSLKGRKKREEKEEKEENPQEKPQEKQEYPQGTHPKSPRDGTPIIIEGEEFLREVFPEIEINELDEIPVKMTSPQKERQIIELMDDPDFSVREPIQEPVIEKKEPKKEFVSPPKNILASISDPALEQRASYDHQRSSYDSRHRNSRERRENRDKHGKKKRHKSPRDAVPIISESRSREYVDISPRRSVDIVPPVILSPRKQESPKKQQRKQESPPKVKPKEPSPIRQPTPPRLSPEKPIPDLISDTKRVANLQYMRNNRRKLQTDEYYLMYDDLPEHVQRKEREQFKARIDILREKNANFPYNYDEKDTTARIVKTYDHAMEYIYVKKKAAQYRDGITVIWLGIEAFCVKVLGITSALGYASYQIDQMSDYDGMLIELGEKNIESAFNDWSVEVRLFVMAVWNLVIFLIVKICASWLGPDGDQTVKKFMNKIRENLMSTDIDDTDHSRFIATAGSVMLNSGNSENTQTTENSTTSTSQSKPNYRPRFSD